VKDDLHDLRIVETGRLYGGDIGVADVTARVNDLGGEAHGGIRLEIVGGTGAVGCDFGIVKLGDVLAEIGVRRQAVAAAVDFGDRKRNPSAGLGVEMAFGQGALRPR
jgi:hypothetical protein